MSKVKIFVIYHKPYHIFKNEVFEPIQTGADFSGIDLGFLKDNTGDNIARKNPNYGELTAWYWVWKNWLPQHPETEYIGFCHYRRFLDLCQPMRFIEYSYRACSLDNFIARFNTSSFSTHTIEQRTAGSDIILPPCLNFMSFECEFLGGNLYDQYSLTHPQHDFQMAAEVYAQVGDQKKMMSFWSGSSFHSCLNFIMRRELFENLNSWMFDFLSLLESKCHWKSYTKYDEVRAPAFLAERYFDLWLSDMQEQMNLKIKTCPRWVLDATPIPRDFPWFLAGIKQWGLWKVGVNRHRPMPDYLFPID